MPLQTKTTSEPSGRGLSLHGPWGAVPRGSGSKLVLKASPGHQSREHGPHAEPQPLTPSGS